MDSLALCDFPSAEGRPSQAVNDGLRDQGNLCPVMRIVAAGAPGAKAGLCAWAGVGGFRGLDLLPQQRAKTKQPVGIPPPRQADP